MSAAAADLGAPAVRGRACAGCLRRTWLLGRLAGHLDQVRDRIDALLELGDDELIAAVGGARADEVSGEYRAFDPDAARARCDEAGQEALCRCDPAYPDRLRDLAAPPAVLHLVGGAGRLDELVAGEPVAVVGARQGSPYGMEIAGGLGRGLGCAGVTVISGMARGIDSAAHRGVLAVDAATIAVLAGGAERAYPASARGLHRRIAQRGVLVSELAPGTDTRRWMFLARNRIIAALSVMTVVVQGRAASGALVTARRAAELGRVVGAVPGPVTSRLSAGPHELLRGGAELVQGAQDVLDGLFGAGAPALADRRRGALSPELAALLEAIADGHEASAAFDRAGLDVDGGLAGLASLELGGWLRRGPGGRFSVAV
ncbi:MAG TPA: DNA-processing protein DprA [Solirubrobacteraceae bacterium]|nr:DNA-processing protein DprA [Solirubrobacteraceae bacterium]